MKNEGGVYTIPCKVNGLDLKFIFDTGASSVTISLTEALFMIKNGHLSEDDIYGSSYYQLANGEILENTEILLREIEIADLKLYNVNATIVHELEAPLLLGLSAISKLGKISLNGNELVIMTNTDNSIKLEYERGKTALDLGNYEQGITSFTYVIENSNDNDLIASSYGNLGIIYDILGNSLESIVMYEQACKMNKSQYCHISAYNKGVMFANEGNFQKSIEEYKRCISLEPNGTLTKIVTGYNNLNYKSHFEIGLIYAIEYGDYNTAVNHFIESIQPYDEEAFGEATWKLNALGNIGYCYYELGDFRKCIEYAKKILEINKYDKNALMSICFSYDELGDLEQAKKYCKMASDLGDERGTEFLKNN